MRNISAGLYPQLPFSLYRPIGCMIRQDDVFQLKISLCVYLCVRS